MLWSSTGRRLTAPLLIVFGLSACSADRAGSAWGSGATLSPGWNQIRAAALTAATDPFTWGPAAGAAAVQIGNLDNEIADWANDETPVFGDRQTAAEASDWLRATSIAAYMAAGLGAPAAVVQSPLRTKAEGFAVGGAAIAATAITVGGTKLLTGRERPVGDEDDSFPSGHTATAAVSARLAHDALDHYALSPGTAFAADAGLVGLTLMTGWARVEAGEHHPADILVGAALGNFVAVFATEAFLPEPVGEIVSLNVEPVGDGWALRLGFPL